MTDQGTDVAEPGTEVVPADDAAARSSRRATDDAGRAEEQHGTRARASTC